jgi:hypothetical protein
MDLPLPPFVILNLFQDNKQRQFVVLKQVQHDEDFV